MELDAFGAIVEALRDEPAEVPVQRFASVFQRIRSVGPAPADRCSGVPAASDGAMASDPGRQVAGAATPVPSGPDSTATDAASNSTAHIRPSAPASTRRRLRGSAKGALFDAGSPAVAERCASVASGGWWRELLIWNGSAASPGAAPDPAQRAQLLASIDAVRHPSHRAWLTELTRRAFDDDPSADVRAAALRALAVLGFGEEDGGRFLRASDGSAHERQAAVETLAGHEFRVSWARGVLQRLAS